MHFGRSSAASRIAIAVRHERLRQQLSQDELALAAGVSVRAVHQIEAAKPTARLDTLERVLTALGLSLRVTGRDGIEMGESGEATARQRVRRR
jgi:transcriptional regulator with XRE-family HTH domain